MQPYIVRELHRLAKETRRSWLIFRSLDLAVTGVLLFLITSQPAPIIHALVLLNVDALIVATLATGVLEPSKTSILGFIILLTESLIGIFALLLAILFALRQSSVPSLIWLCVLGVTAKAGSIGFFYLHQLYQREEIFRFSEAAARTQRNREVLAKEN